MMCLTECNHSGESGVSQNVAGLKEESRAAPTAVSSTIPCGRCFDPFLKGALSLHLTRTPRGCPAGEPISRPGFHFALTWLS